MQGDARPPYVQATITCSPDLYKAMCDYARLRGCSWQEVWREAVAAVVAPPTGAGRKAAKR